MTLLQEYDKDQFLDLYARTNFRAFTFERLQVKSELFNFSDGSSCDKDLEEGHRRSCGKVNILSWFR